MQSDWSFDTKSQTLMDAMLLRTSSSGTEQQVSIIGKLIVLLLGVAILSLSAHFKVPFYPVPMTLQTLVVLLIGMSYGLHLGGATILSYLYWALSALLYSLVVLGLYIWLAQLVVIWSDFLCLR